MGNPRPRATGGAGHGAPAGPAGGEPDAEQPTVLESASLLPLHKRLPDFLSSVNIKYVKLGYHALISHAWKLLVVPLGLAILAELSAVQKVDLLVLWEHLQFNLVAVVLSAAAIVLAATLYFVLRPRPVFLVDFSCYRAEDKYKVNHDVFMEGTRGAGCFTPANIEFQEKIALRSGLGEHTYLSKGLMTVPKDTSMEMARAEARDVMFGALQQLLDKTKIRAKDIDILVVNCSLFNPTPSLSAMVVNHFKLRSNVRTYNLSGMGCSAGVISIDLAKDLLQTHGNSLAVVISTENITQNWYFGNQRSMLVPNCLFRVGGAAILLSNKRSLRRRSKYELLHTVRTHKGADEKCYTCVYQMEDSEGNTGVSLSKEVMAVAGEALKTNITTLGPLVLPLSEQLIFFVMLIARKILKMKVKPYIPDFKLAFEHFCIHAGGRAVIDELEKNLSLTPYQTEPSRKTLWRFGNTSSSSIWYELAYSEAAERVKRGDRVWQIAFGSGFKCNSAVWRALRNIKPSPDSPWADEVGQMAVAGKVDLS
eukprot:jgi/Chlat1/8371/Chrsp80S07801